MTPSDHPMNDDSHLWLEDVLGERALNWVRERNAESERLLTADPRYAPMRQQIQAVLDSKDRIPSVSRHGAWLYNLWRDEAHPRGLWRRTTLDSYRQTDTNWQTVLDIDALAATEGENWVWGGATRLDTAPQRCLVALSRGGADATVVREFDIEARAFIDGGFLLPEAKSSVTWVDIDTLIVGTDFGPGSLTDSGYPRVLKRWTRGTPLADAVTVFEGEAQDVSVDVDVDLTPGHGRTIWSRSIDFYHQVRWLQVGDERIELDLPRDASHAFWNHAHGSLDTLLVELRSEWTTGGVTWPSGSLIATDAAAFLRGERVFTSLFAPTPTCSLASFSATRSHLIVNTLDNVASRLRLWQRTEQGFVERPIEAPFPGTLGVDGLDDPMQTDDPLAECFLLGYTDFLTPDSLYFGRFDDADAGRADRAPALELLKSRPALFDATGMAVEQRFATSADGTQVPYFIVWPRGAATRDRDRDQQDSNAAIAVDSDAASDGVGPRPTLLYGYGGFEVSLNPWYSGGFGRAWFERGGVLVVANIRGGGEYGPEWHQSATMEHKPRSHDDFIAVAEHLIAQGVTTPAQLGIMGGSNGGLLVGAAFTRRPDLFNAVVCQVPLLDMKRYHLLLAGASWMAEYGNPDDPDEWAFIAPYSPYQNLRAGVRYPKVLFTTSTRDDRVHPGHARKMVARLRELGYEVLLYENTEGGHGGAADNTQRAHLQALEFCYLWQQLGPAV